MSAITESNCRKPQPVHNQNVIAQFVNQSERAYEIFRSVPESYGPVIDQSQHSYHLYHIRNICYFMGGRSVSRKVCLRSWMYGPSRFGEGRAFKTEGKVFLDTDRPRETNENRNVYLNMCMPSAGFRRAGNPIDVSYGSKTDNLRYKPRKWCGVMS